MTDNRTWLVTGAGGMLGQDVLAGLGRPQQMLSRRGREPGVADRVRILDEERPEHADQDDAADEHESHHEPGCEGGEHRAPPGARLAGGDGGGSDADRAVVDGRFRRLLEIGHDRFPFSGQLRVRVRGSMRP